MNGDLMIRIIRNRVIKINNRRNSRHGVNREAVIEVVAVDAEIPMVTMVGEEVVEVPAVAINKMAVVVVADKDRTTGMIVTIRTDINRGITIMKGIPITIVTSNVAVVAVDQGVVAVTVSTWREEVVDAVANFAVNEAAIVELIHHVVNHKRNSKHQLLNTQQI